MKLETAPAISLDEALFLRGKSYSINIKQNNSQCLKRNKLTVCGAGSK